MNKKTLDIITVIYCMVILALSAMNNSLLVFLVFPFVIRPILREYQLIDGVDERDRLVEYRASHIALLITLSFVIIVFCISHFKDHKNPAQEWYIVLLLPIIAKWFIHLGHEKGIRKLGLGIAFVFGLIWFMFTVLSHGISLETLIESVFGLLILVPAFLSLRWPKIGGSLLIIVGIGVAAFFSKAWIQNFDSVYNVFLMELILPFPVILSGILLVVDALKKETDEFSDLRHSGSLKGEDSDEKIQ